MSIDRVSDVHFSDLVEGGYDVAIFASGYESRCLQVPRLLRQSDISAVVVLGFEDLATSKERLSHDEYFKTEWAAPPIISKSDDDFVIQSVLNELQRLRGPLHRILVDYSSMSRIWYAGLLNWVRYASNSASTVIDFVYSCGQYQEDFPQMVIKDMLMVPGCEGATPRSGKSIAVFGLGFNGWASKCVLERLEADEVFAFVANPGSSEGYPSRVRLANAEFLEEPRLLNHTLDLPLASVTTSYRYLAELVCPNLARDSITLVPMGPKPHVLASILLAIKFPEVACLRVSAMRAYTEAVSPTGELIVTRVVVNGEQRPLLS